MKPHPTVDRAAEAPARNTEYDTSEMLRQVFLRARFAPHPEDRCRVRTQEVSP